MFKIKQVYAWNKNKMTVSGAETQSQDLLLPHW